MVYLNPNYSIGVTILLSLFEFNILRFQKLGKRELQGRKRGERGSFIAPIHVESRDVLGIEDYE